MAGVQYKGTFGASATPGAVVNLGLGFETVYPLASRNQMMSDVLNYFLTPVPVGITYFGQL